MLSKFIGQGVIAFAILAALAAFFIVGHLLGWAGLLPDIWAALVWLTPLWLVIAGQFLFGLLWYAGDKYYEPDITIWQAQKEALFKYWLAVDMLAQIIIAPIVNRLYHPPVKWGDKIRRTISFYLAMNYKFFKDNSLFWSLVIYVIELIDPPHFKKHFMDE